MARLKHLLAAAVGLMSALATAASASTDVATGIVRAMYQRGGGGPTDPWLASDLSAAIRKQPADTFRAFDFLYGGQRDRISGLNFVTETDGPQASVTAVFQNRGKAFSVNWTLCQRRDGRWLIANAGSVNTGDPWDLRTMLNLPEAVAC